jgi:hypothetical protein
VEVSNKHIMSIEEIVRQVGHLPELNEDAQSEKYDLPQVCFFFSGLIKFLCFPICECGVYVSVIHLLSVMFVTICERSNICSGQILAIYKERFVLIKTGNNKTIIYSFCRIKTVVWK